MDETNKFLLSLLLLLFLLLLSLLLLSSLLLLLLLLLYPLFYLAFKKIYRFSSGNSVNSWGAR